MPRIDASTTNSRRSTLQHGKPVAQVLVEGELSPFEHEALYQLLREEFQVEQPSYVDLPDEDLITRVNITFQHPYTLDLFTLVLREDWRGLKNLLREIRHRRGRAGAAFSLAFVNGDHHIVFRSGLLDSEETSSALDQIGHLTGIVGQMIREERSVEPLGLIECSFDKKSDRWSDFRAYSLSKERMYTFDNSTFTWMRTESSGSLSPISLSVPP